MQLTNLCLHQWNWLMMKEYKAEMGVWRWRNERRNCNVFKRSPGLLPWGQLTWGSQWQGWRPLSNSLSSWWVQHNFGVNSCWRTSQATSVYWMNGNIKVVSSVIFVGADQAAQQVSGLFAGSANAQTLIDDHNIWIQALVDNITTMFQ